jgi:uridine kinase
VADVDARPVLERLAALTPRRGLLLVGIGGHGCAGKTTLARLIPGAQVVGTDEFWDGSGFDLARVRSDVLEPLLRGEEARYRSYDWTAQASRRELRVVRPRGLVVIDGVCALHRMFRDAYDLRVWVDAPVELRLARAVARDGEAARRRWLEVWIPGEDRYVAADDPVSCADLVVDGSA